MDDRDSLILDHIGRYTLSLRTVIEDLFFDGGSCGATLNSLVKKGLVQRVKNALANNYSYYQLTAKGAQSRGLTTNKATGKNPTALAQNLAALWFSCKSNRIRKRLTAEELDRDTLFGSPKGGNVIFVAQNGYDDETTVFRLVVPGEEIAVKSAYVSSLKESAVECINNDRLRPWIERGTYRFAILVHSDARKEQLKNLIHRPGFPKLPVEIEIIPTPTTIPDWMAAGQEDE